MALFSDPSVYRGIWNAKFNRPSRIDYVGDKFINARRELGTKMSFYGYATVFLITKIRISILSGFSN